MPVTLTDEQAAELRQRLTAAETNRKIAEASAEIWNDPELGDSAKGLWKKKFPNTDLGGYDVEQRINARFDKERQEREAAAKAEADRRQDERIAEERREAQARYSLTDDAMKRVEDFMVERNIGDYEVAAEHFVSRNPRVSDGRDAGYDSHFWQ